MKGAEMTATATVEVLTAEVRVLMVGSRQITLSVARQLDQTEPEDIEPFGRIRIDKTRVDLIGRCKHTGDLVTAFMPDRVVVPYVSEADLQDAKIIVPAPLRRFDRQADIRLHYDGSPFVLAETAAENCSCPPYMGGEDPCICSGWVATHQIAYEIIKRRIAENKERDEWAQEVRKMPLIVLAGLK